MKKVILFFLLACICKTSGAQILIAILFGEKLNTGKLEFGLTVNPAITNITNTDSDPKWGLNLGIYFNIRPDKKFFFHIEGIAKGSFGAKSIAPYPTGNDSLDHLFEDGKIERIIRAFSLPVVARYALSPKVYAEAGIQANMRLKVKDELKTKVNDQELLYTIVVSDEFTRLDFGITGGLFYKFKSERTSMGMGIRYFQGLTDIHKTVVGIQQNTSWQIVITIPIGANPKKSQTGNSESK